MLDRKNVSRHMLEHFWRSLGSPKELYTDEAFQTCFNLWCANWKKQKCDGKLEVWLETMPCEFWSKKNETAVHLVALIENKRLMEYLIPEHIEHINHKIKMSKWLYEIPLFRAIENRDTEIVKILLNAGAILDHTFYVNDSGPLHLAVHHGYPEIVKMLIDSGADINGLNMFHKTPLVCAIQEAKNYKVTKMLVDCGSSTKFSHIQNFSPLHGAIRRNNHELFNYLLRLDTDVDLLTARENEECDGRTYKGINCLHIAALYERYDMVDKLLKLGADMSAKSEENFSFLFFLVVPHSSPIILSSSFRVEQCSETVRERKYKERMVKIFISRGAARNFDPDREFPELSIMLQWIDVEFMKFLIKECDIDLKKYVGNLNEFLATSVKFNGSLEMLEFLVEEGKFDLNARNSSGRTFLFDAILAEYGEKECLVKYLLEAGADVHVASKFCDRFGTFYNLYPLGIAAAQGYAECVRHLIRYNADINEGDILPLELAIKPHNVEGFRGINFEGLKESAQVLICHIAIKEILNQPVEERNLKAINSDRSSRNLHRNCLAELRIMQQRIVHERISFFDVLSDAQRYSMNRYVIEQFRDAAVVDSFATYGKILVEKFEEARKRTELLEAAELVLMSIFKCDSTAFTVVFKNILQYLNNKSLHNLILAQESPENLDDEVIRKDQGPLINALCKTFRNGFHTTVNFCKFNR